MSAGARGPVAAVTGLEPGFADALDAEFAEIHAFDAVANVTRSESVNLERAALSSALDVVRFVVGEAVHGIHDPRG